MSRSLIIELIRIQQKNKGLCANKIREKKNEFI